MDAKKLASLLGSRDLHTRLLGNYEGAYALGVVSKEGAPALQLRVEAGTRASAFASFIVLDGEKVPVFVLPDFKKPVAKPLQVRAVAW
jgi:hypothetical protein